ncbi:4452_t:CDS:2 [Acaulospora morrowiae]|uniref:4452_t:CDS:1 n=1 Tax=Acaulospora morrowiae TaxID=94023 RepID=A0A9N8ZRN0_9GLOM|nr:4452_t:CDS:2 [Acaulospora morrowiae]
MFIPDLVCLTQNDKKIYILDSYVLDEVPKTVTQRTIRVTQKFFFLEQCWISIDPLTLFLAQKCHACNVTEEKPAPTLAEVVRKLNTEKLIEFLRGEEDLQLVSKSCEIRSPAVHSSIRPKQNFLVMLRKKIVFSSYRSLRDVLLKYNLDSDDTLFMKHYRSLVLDSLESMQNEYVSTSLHTALYIAREYEIVGDEGPRRVDYGIKESENLICVTEDKVQRSILEEISQASEIPYNIEINKKALEKDSEECQALYKGVKKVLSIIVGLLKDQRGSVPEFVIYVLVNKEMNFPNVPDNMDVITNIVFS